jgi:hypothetical protein
MHCETPGIRFTMGSEDLNPWKYSAGGLCAG